MPSSQQFRKFLLKKDFPVTAYSGILRNSFRDGLPSAGKKIKWHDLMKSNVLQFPLEPRLQNKNAG